MFSRSAVSNWSVAIGIPSANFTAELRNKLGWLVTAILILLAGSLGAASFVASRIAHAIRGLRAAALALGQGKDVVMPALRLKEASAPPSSRHRSPYKQHGTRQRMMFLLACPTAPCSTTWSTGRLLYPNVLVRISRCSISIWMVLSPSTISMVMRPAMRFFAKSLDACDVNCANRIWLRG